MAHDPPPADRRPPSMPQHYAHRDLLAMYPHLRDDHLRYLEKWGLIRPARQTDAGRVYAFGDLRVLRQAEAELAAGVPFRAVLRALAAEQHGQLAFDFRIEAAPARVLELRRREAPQPSLLPPDPEASGEATTRAEACFVEAARLDEAGAEHQAEAARAYRRALQADPNLVAALINLGNIHYARDAMAEAQALYERALALEPDAFEAHFNLGNIYHDLGRFRDAEACYRDALALNPTYADAHFYLAVTLEKLGDSVAARPHWRQYQRLSPNGEWVALAREFSGENV